MRPIEIKREYFIEWLRNITSPTIATLKVRTKQKVGKSTSLYEEYGEIFKEATVQVLLCWHLDAETMEKLQNYSINTDGQKWQENEGDNPLAFHRETEKRYLRVLPVNAGKNTIRYVSASGEEIPAKTVEALLYSTGKKEISNIPVHFLYSLDSIEEVEIEDQLFVIK